MCDHGILCFFMFLRLNLLMVITHDVCVSRKPAVIMIVGVNGGGKTTSLGMFDDNGIMSFTLFSETYVIN